MNVQKEEDVKDTALKLNEIKMYCQEDYFYLKGFIQCLLQKGKQKNQSKGFKKKREDFYG